MSLDFTAVDFETANSQPGSVCAVGLVRVRAGQVAGKSGGLVRPPDGLGEFTDYQTSVHGITAEMVATAPPWRKVAAWINQYTGPDSPDATRCSSTPAAQPWSRSPCHASTGPVRPANWRKPSASAWGVWNPAATSPPPGTARKAGKGQDIEVMTEDDFIRSL